MMVSGVDASMCATTSDTCVSRMTEVAVTTVPAGTSGRVEYRCDTDRNDDQTDEIIAGSLPHSNSVPSVQIQCRMTASLRASAVWAFL